MLTVVILLILCYCFYDVHNVDDHYDDDDVGDNDDNYDDHYDYDDVGGWRW